LTYRILNSALCICRLPPGSAVPAPAGDFFSATVTRREISIVCHQPPPGATQVEAGWIALEVIGPLPFSLTGVLASLTVPLAEAGVPVFAISTFDTDYLLIKAADLDSANRALLAAGHESVGD
jgi:hypothetical protein